MIFSDLVGSTALSARLDPEDLREVISAYQRCVAETVRRFGGIVARYMTKKKDVVWFALNDYRPLFAFAGIVDAISTAHIRRPISR